MAYIGIPLKRFRGGAVDSRSSHKIVYLVLVLNWGVIVCVSSILSLIYRLHLNVHRTGSTILSLLCLNNTLLQPQPHNKSPSSAPGPFTLYYNTKVTFLFYNFKIWLNSGFLYFLFSILNKCYIVRCSLHGDSLHSVWNLSSHMNVIIISSFHLYANDIEYIWSVHRTGKRIFILVINLNISYNVSVILVGIKSILERFTLYLIRYFVIRLFLITLVHFCNN